MLDVGWSELLVIGAVALVAVGPKDLPKVMHQLGVWAGKARRLLLSLQQDFERLSREAEDAAREERDNEAGLAAQRHEPPPVAEEVEGEEALDDEGEEGRDGGKPIP